MPALLNSSETANLETCSLKRGEYPPYENIRSLYWDKSLSRSEIGDLYGVGKERVRSWMKHLNIEARSMKEYPLIAAHPLQPHLVPSVALAHTLGVLFGDGFVCEQQEYGNYIIALRTVSREFAESFNKSLSSIGLHPFTKENDLKTSIDGKSYMTHYFDVRAYSKIFFTWFNAQNLNDVEQLLETKEQKIAFLRGLYESEGSFGYWKMGKSRIWIFRIVMTDRRILELSKRLFKKLGYEICLTHGSLTRNNLRLHSLEKKGKQALEIIKILNPCIKGEKSHARFN